MSGCCLAEEERRSSGTGALAAPERIARLFLFALANVVVAEARDAAHGTDNQSFLHALQSRNQ